MKNEWRITSCDVELMLKVLPVGTPPPDDTWHTFLSGSPQEDTWLASPIRTPLGRGTQHSQTSHPDDCHITSRRPTYPIQICLSGLLTKVSKSYYVIPTACHGPRFAACRAKGQEWWQVTSHDLWQPRCLPRSLSATCRVMMALPPPRGIMTSQKVSLPLNRETELLILYIRTFTQGGR